VKKLIPQTPEAETIGTNARAILKSINLKNFQHILEKYAITTIEPDKWYPHTLILDVMRDIQDRKMEGMFDLVSIGMQVVDRDTPRMLPTLPETLFALPKLDARLHHGSPRNYIVEQVDERCIRIEDYTPWPHDLVFGILWQLTMKYKDDNVKPTVERVAEKFDAAHGDEVGIYEIRW